MKLNILIIILASLTAAVLLVKFSHNNDNDQDYGPF